MVSALTGKDRRRLQRTGTYAPNLLGLCDQVPARVEFLTDGTSRTVKAGPMQIVLKRTTPRQMAELTLFCYQLRAVVFAIHGESRRSAQE